MSVLATARSYAFGTTGVLPLCWPAKLCAGVPLRGSERPIRVLTPTPDGVVRRWFQSTAASAGIGICRPRSVCDTDVCPTVRRVIDLVNDCEREVGSRDGGTALSSKIATSSPTRYLPVGSPAAHDP